jgi:uncharacterized membrane protein YfcA
MTAILVGFIIATTIGLTGVGGGTIATPLLIIVLRMKGAVAVGTALTLAAIIKFLVVPLYMYRRQVNYKILAWMALGGVPGVVLGGSLLKAASKTLDQHVLYLILGITIFLAAALNIYRLVRPPKSAVDREHPRLLSALMFPVGAEVGFSSAGSGALGSLALLGLTKLEAASVVGTDLTFGLILSVIGSGIQVVAGNFDGEILTKLLIGGVVGAFVGGFLANKIPSRPLKWGLAVWLAGLGINLFMRGLPA